MSSSAFTTRTFEDVLDLVHALTTALFPLSKLLFLMNTRRRPPVKNVKRILLPAPALEGKLKNQYNFTAEKISN